MTEGSDGRNDDAEESGGLSRRTVLGGLATGGVAAAVVGYAATRRDPGPVPEEHDWDPADPPLATPWFKEVSAEDPHAEYPRPQLVRERWHHLNGVWGFEAAVEGNDPPTDRQLEEGVLVPFSVESALSSLAREEDRMWYRRTFEIPEDWDVRDEERLLLHFEAVDYEATVYVNGERVGSHVGGYDHFAFDVADALTEARRQEVVVGVVDETKEGQTLGKQHPNDDAIWYTPASGIWQSVWLEPVPWTRVTEIDATPDLENDRLELAVETTGGASPTVEATALADGETVATASGAPDETLSLSIPNPTYWSPDEPFLYDLEIRLRRGGETGDRVTSYFGMRAVETRRVNGRSRMLLNGEVSFALATLDQGYWPDGIYTAPTDDALASDLEKHRKLGFNAVRKHVKVEPRRWYYHADRLGLVVHQDVPSTADFTGGPDEEQKEQFESEVREILTELRNHPSITAWVPFNEGWGIFDAERITDLVAERDPERLVNPNSGANVDGGDCECGDVLDYHNYPGPGSVPPAEDRLTVLGEYGGMGLVLDDHAWGSENFSYDAYLTSAGLTDAYVEKAERVQLLAAQCGLSSAVYTQLTDVETENNGLLTYDRKAFKVDRERVQAANEALIEVGTTADAWPAEKSGDPSGMGYWPLDDVDAVAADAAGDADMRVSGDPTPVDGPSGGGLSFDGDALETESGVLDTRGGYSVAAWVRLSEQSGTQVAVSQDGESVSAFSLRYEAGSERFAFAVAERDAAEDPVRVRAADPAEGGRWYHLLGVRDAANGTIRLYVDGTRADETAFCPGFESTGPTVVGRGRFDGIATSYWRGSVNEVRVFEWALSDEDAAAAFERTH